MALEQYAGPGSRGGHMTRRSRLSVIDGLKVLASQTIVLHHLASYGPLADAAHACFPLLFEWLFGYGRIAVQVFLVAGGFLAARSLAPAGVLADASAFELLTRRYIRLALPLVAAVLLAVFCASVARGMMVDDAIPAAPGVFQFLAHVFLLHDLVGVPALSAGVWYVAIDFQLYALTIGLLWLAKRLARDAAHAERAGMAVLGVVAVLSLFSLNRDSDWDVAAPYHFAAYAMGMFGFWLTARRRLPVFWICVALLTVVVSLALAFRLRLAVALAVACLVAMHVRTGVLADWFSAERIGRLARSSYALFLVHFPVCLIVNAAFAQAGLSSPAAVLAALGLAWGLSMALASIFHREVELRADQFLRVSA